MLKFVPPAGAPVRSAVLLRGLGKAILENGDAEAFPAALATRLGARHIFGVSSGRAALWLILKTLGQLRPGRNVVGLPAYTCFSVAASVARCGMKIFPIELIPETLDFDFAAWEATPPEKLLCLVSGNLFGLVNDGGRMEEAARANGAFLVDDAAQALGATRNGSFAGTRGDVGFYSLARGKALGSTQGGLIVTNSDTIAAAIAEEVARLEKAPAAKTVGLALKTGLYAAFLHPRLFWVPRSLPFLKLGRTEFDPGFPVAPLPNLSRASLPGLIAMLSEASRTPQRNAAAIAERVARLPQFSLPRTGGDCQPSYPRFPVLARDGATRQEAVRRLQKSGIGASSFYPSAICDIPGIEQHMAVRYFHRPRAEDLAERVFTLPTHAYVGPREIERMAAILSELAEESNADGVRCHSRP